MEVEDPAPKESTSQLNVSTTTAKPRKSKKGKRKAGEEEEEDVPKDRLGWDNYVEVDEPAPKGKGGRPMTDNSLKEIFVLCYLKADASRKTLVRCIGMKNGCKETWSYPRVAQRLLTHASDCEHLPSDLKARINSNRAKESPSVKVQALLTAETFERSSKRSRNETTAPDTPNPRMQKSSLRPNHLSKKPRDGLQ